MSFLVLPDECIVLCLDWLPVTDLLRLTWTCQRLRTIAHSPAAMKVFEHAHTIAYAETNTCQPLLDEFGRRLMERDWSMKYLIAFLDLMKDLMVQRVHRVQKDRCLLQNGLIEAIVKACRSLPNTPSGQTRLYDLCLALAARKYATEGCLLKRLYRELPVRCPNRHVLAQYVRTIVHYITLAGPFDLDMHWRAGNMLSTAANWVRASHPEISVAMRKELYFRTQLHDLLYAIFWATRDQARLREDWKTLIQNNMEMMQRSEFVPLISQSVEALHEKAVVNHCGVTVQHRSVSQ